LETGKKGQPELSDFSSRGENTSFRAGTHTSIALTAPLNRFPLFSSDPKIIAQFRLSLLSKRNDRPWRQQETTLPSLAPAQESRNSFPFIPFTKDSRRGGSKTSNCKMGDGQSAFAGGSITE